jgi:hypothetical protein
MIASGILPEGRCSSSAAARATCWTTSPSRTRRVHGLGGDGPDAEGVEGGGRERRALQYGSGLAELFDPWPDAAPGTEEFDLFIKEVVRR